MSKLLTPGILQQATPKEVFVGDIAPDLIVAIGFIPLVSGFDPDVDFIEIEKYASGGTPSGREFFTYTEFYDGTAESWIGAGNGAGLYGIKNQADDVWLTRDNNSRQPILIEVGGTWKTASNGLRQIKTFGRFDPALSNTLKSIGCSYPYTTSDKILISTVITPSYGGASGRFLSNLVGSRKTYGFRMGAANTGTKYGEDVNDVWTFSNCDENPGIFQDDIDRSTTTPTITSNSNIVEIFNRNTTSGAYSSTIFAQNVLIWKGNHGDKFNAIREKQKELYSL